MANEPLEKGLKTRTVIITDGCNSILVARTGKKNVEEVPVTSLAAEEIVDKNGVGDAFVGGFLAQYVLEKSFDTCIRCAVFCASECIKQIGCSFPKDMKFT